MLAAGYIPPSKLPSPLSSWGNCVELRKVQDGVENEGLRPGTSGRLRRMSLIWPVTYSFNITLALGYIVLGIVLDCKPTPVPRLFIIGRKKKPLAVLARRRVVPSEDSLVPFDFSSPECMPSMPPSDISFTSNSQIRVDKKQHPAYVDNM